MTAPANGYPANERPAEGYGYATGGYTGAGYEPAGPAGQPDIAGNGYRPTGPDRTELLPPASRRQPGRDRAAELDLDEAPSHRRPAPPPLRLPERARPVPERSGWSAIGAPATPPAAPPAPRQTGPRLRVDWPNCKAHGLCHELLPEMIGLDEWGYPVIGKDPLPAKVVDDARRAVTACPTLALRIVD
jgi:ferredoxin